MFVLLFEMNELSQAVQEFTDLCKNSSAEAVESALPFWPRLFNKLAMVRCQSHYKNKTL